VNAWQAIIFRPQYGNKLTQQSGAHESPAWPPELWPGPFLFAVRFE